MIQNTKRFLIIMLLIACLLPAASAIPTVVTISETGTWTCPQNVFIVQIKITGAGGGGLGGNQTWNGYAGMNGTTWYYSDVAVVPDTVYPITIGSGGLGSVGSSGTLDYVSGSAGGDTTAFGHTIFGGSGATAFISPRQQRGLDGYGYVTLATSGGDGTGNVTYAQAGGAGGIGYGASGGGGGMGGIGGTGGFGGKGAPGAVEITYDPEAANVLFAGTTYDADTGVALTGVTGTISQASTSVAINTGGGSTFSVLSSSGIITGRTVTISMSKSGYHTYTNSFIPYVSEIIPINIPLIPATFDVNASGTISGLTLNQYGSMIPSVEITMTNSSGGLLSTTSTSGGFWYFQNVPKNTRWYASANATAHNESYKTFNVWGY